MTTPTRAPSPALLAALRGEEGLPPPHHGQPALHAYADPRTHGAPWTIGFGRAHGVGPHDTCTAAQAEAWLVEDAQNAIKDILTHLPWTVRLDPVRFDVLTDMCFNMGWFTFSGFKLTLADVEEGAYVPAAERMLSLPWARQVGDRAKRLALEMRTGVRA